MTTSTKAKRETTAVSARNSYAGCDVLENTRKSRDNHYRRGMAKRLNERNNRNYEKMHNKFVRKQEHQGEGNRSRLSGGGRCAGGTSSWTRGFCVSQRMYGDAGEKMHRKFRKEPEDSFPSEQDCFTVSTENGYNELSENM